VLFILLMLVLKDAAVMLPLGWKSRDALSQSTLSILLVICAPQNGYLVGMLHTLDMNDFWLPMLMNAAARRCLSVSSSLV
jgi:hypothetical protein